MSIDKRPDGRYRVRVTEPDGRERAKHFARKIDAAEWEAEQRVAITKGTYLSADRLRVTLGAYVTSHLERQVWRPRTVTVAKSALARAEGYFGSDRPLTAIRRSDVEKFIVALSRKFKPGTVHLTMQHFRGVMRAALADGLITIDPTFKMKLPTVVSGLVVPTVEQIHALIDSAWPSFAIAIVLGAQVGLRVGEAQGLLVSDVDFLKRTVNVRRQLDGSSTGMCFIDTKTASSHRAVPVPAVVLDQLAHHVERFGPGRDGVLLHDEGNFMSDNAFNYRWRRAQVGAGLKEGAMRYHWLRHAFASSLISAGCSVKSVATALGHADPSITLRTYASMWPGDEDRVRHALSCTWSTDAAGESLRTFPDFSRTETGVSGL